MWVFVSGQSLRIRWRASGEVALFLLPSNMEYFFSWDAHILSMSIRWAAEGRAPLFDAIWVKLNNQAFAVDGVLGIL